MRSRCSLFTNWVFTFLLVGGFLCFAGTASAQEQQSATTEDLPNPRNALLKSVVMPGWGHYYVNQEDWNRGKYHLAADVVMVAAYVGLRIRSDHFENDLISFARAKAGADLSGRDRQYRLAIGNFDNREAYNEYYLKVRGWDQLYPEQEQYQWNWTNEEARSQYNNMRQRVDKIDRQLPALLSLMVVNRVVSGISAYLQARDVIDRSPKVGLAPTGGGGMATQIQIPL